MRSAAKLIFILSLLLLPAASHGQGSGVGTLDQWKSDGTNITQRTVGKPLKLTGLSDGCTELVNGILTVVSGDPCGTGSGGGSDGNFVYNPSTDTLRQATSTTKVGLGTTTPYAKLSVVGEVVASHFTGTTTATSTLGGGLSTTRIDASATSTLDGLNIETGGLKVSTLGTGLTLATNGEIGLYAGTSCTNQFPRSLSVSGVATCASVVLTSDVTGTLPYANGGTGTTTAPVSQLLYGGTSAYQSVATTTLTVGNGLAYSGTMGAVVGGVAGSLTATLGTTIAPNELVGQPFGSDVILGTNSAGTGFNATGTASALTVHSLISTSTATSTFAGGVQGVTAFFSGLAHFIGELIAPFAADPTVDKQGEIALDTTTASSSLHANIGGTEVAFYPDRDISFEISSSTPGWGDSIKFNTGTTTRRFRNPYRAFTLNNFYCETDKGTLLVRVGDGTASTTHASASATGGTASSLSNNVFTGREDVWIEIGSSATTPNNLACTLNITPSP